MKARKSIIISIIWLCLLLPAAKIANAATLGISLTPSLYEANIKPGKTISSVFTFQNDSNQEQTFIARVIPFSPEDNRGNPSLKPNLRPEWLKYFSLSNADIELNEPFSLSANQTIQLILTISVPSKAASSDLYATLLVTSVVKDNREASSTLGAAIGSNLLITVSPMSHPPSLVRITDFSLTKESFLFRYADIYIADNLTPIRFTAVAKNVGKYMVKSAGTLKVEKNERASFTQSLLANNILANSERVLEGSPSGELLFKPALTSIGEYLAILDLRSENSSSHAELTILILPFKLGLAIIVAIIILVSVIKFTKKKKNV